MSEGRCFDGNLSPFQPFVEAFSVLDDDERDELAEKFPALAPLLPWKSVDESNEVDRTELFSSVVAGLDHLALSVPILLVVEDVHWADEATLDVLTLLATRVATAPALVVASYRDDEPDRAAQLRFVLGELVRPPGRVEDAPLSGGGRPGRLGAHVRA